MIDRFKIKMGQPVTDSLTGFFGVVTGRCEHINSAHTYEVTPKVKDNRMAEPVWIVEDRLTIATDEGFGFEPGKEKP